MFPNEPSFLSLYVHNITHHFCLSYEKFPLAWQSTERFEATFNLLNKTTSNNHDDTILSNWINFKWNQFWLNDIKNKKSSQRKRMHLYEWKLSYKWLPIHLKKDEESMALIEALAKYGQKEGEQYIFEGGVIIFPFPPETINKIKNIPK